MKSDIKVFSPCALNFFFINFHIRQLSTQKIKLRAHGAFVLFLRKSKKVKNGEKS
jgi:hypothetical protein